MRDLENLKTIAVLIDAENAQYKAIGRVLDELSKHGNVLAKNAYGDWSAAQLKAWPEVLEVHAIRPHHQFARSSGKNAIDIAMVIDAMDMFHSENFDAFALVSSDADFTGLASRLRRGGKFVFGFGEEKTPLAFRNACDDFIVTTLLMQSPQLEGSSVTQPALSERELEVVELLKSAATEYGDSDGWALVSRAGAMIKRQRPDFNPQAYGSRSLLQLISSFSELFEHRKVPRGDGTADEYRDRSGA